MEFKLLQEKCEQKRLRAVEASQKLCKNLLESDLKKTMDSFNDRLVKTDNTHYLLDEKIAIRITDDGLLSIIDDRTTAYGWTIELMIEDIKTQDFIDYNGKIYLVQNIYGNEFATVNEEVQKIIDEFDETIKKLSQLQPLEKWCYKYYSAHEDIICDSLGEMLQHVIKRK